MIVVYLTWCLPQTIVGFLIYVYYKLTSKSISVCKYEECYLMYIKSKSISSFSCGCFIFINILTYDANNSVRHEHGHVLQSFILGWLYLIVIGLSSIILNILARVNKDVEKNYYKCFPENWADKLGGVNR